MAKEMEQYGPGADLQPMFGPGGGYAPNGYDGGGTYADTGPDWMDPIPPFGLGDGIKDKIDRGWSYIARWPRYLAAGLLWYTYTVWRFSYITMTIVGLLILLLK